MKKENIISDIKTAAVVATAAMTLSGCGHKELSESQLQMVQHKTDSAVNANNEYRIARTLTFLVDDRIEQYRNANMNMVKKYSMSYIKRDIKDATLRKYMIDAILNKNSYDIEMADNIEYNDSADTENVSQTMQYIRNNQRWFNDLMLYLNGKYTDRQLLNSEFFKIIKNDELKRRFEYNTGKIEELTKNTTFLSQRQDTIRGKIYDKYVREAQRKR